MAFGDLVPDDRRKIDVPEIAAMLLNGGMQRDDGVFPGVLTPRQADITHDTDESAAWHKRVETPFPDDIEFVQEALIISDVAQLMLVRVVLLQGPVRRGSHHEVDALWVQLHLPHVLAPEIVFRGNLLNRVVDGRQQPAVLRDPGGRSVCSCGRSRSSSGTKARSVWGQVILLVWLRRRLL